jgi:hypothetical protein
MLYEMEVRHPVCNDIFQLILSNIARQYVTSNLDETLEK